MWTDPIVEEVRRVRIRRAERLDNDIDAIVREIEESQNAGGRLVVRRPPRVPHAESVAVDREKTPAA